MASTAHSTTHTAWQHRSSLLAKHSCHWSSQQQSQSHIPWRRRRGRRHRSSVVVNRNTADRLVSRQHNRSYRSHDGRNASCDVKALPAKERSASRWHLAQNISSLVDKAIDTALARSRLQHCYIVEALARGRRLGTGLTCSNSSEVGGCVQEQTIAVCQCR
jgi:hypothetical protein